MELNNFETLDRHPMHVEKTNNLDDWSVQPDSSWDDDPAAATPDTIIVIELPCSDNKSQVKSIYPLNIDNSGSAAGGAGQTDYIELGLFGLILFATAIVILRE